MIVHDDLSRPSSKPSDKHVVAVFDLDGTLTTRDTLLPVLIHFGAKQKKLYALIMMPLVLGGYLIGVFSPKSAKEKLLTLFFQGEQIELVRRCVSEFLQRWIPSHVHPDGARALQAHQLAGDTVILLSASPDLYVPIVAGLLGIEVSVCTKVQVCEDRVTGHILGNNIAGDAKLGAIRAVVDSAQSWVVAYGNSKSDLPVLCWANEGYMVSRDGIVRVQSATY